MIPHDHNAIEAALEARQEEAAPDPVNPAVAPPGYWLHRRTTKGDGALSYTFDPPVECRLMRRALLFHIASRTWLPWVKAKGVVDEYGAWATPLPPKPSRRSFRVHPAPTAAPTERPL